MKLSEVRILGVLQRFAIVYAVVAVIEVIFQRAGQYLPPVRTEIVDRPVRPKLKTRLIHLLYDILNFPFQWMIHLILITIWLLLVYLVPFENCPAGYLGPGPFRFF